MTLVPWTEAIMDLDECFHISIQFQQSSAMDPPPVKTPFTSTSHQNQHFSGIHTERTPSHPGQFQRGIWMWVAPWSLLCLPISMKHWAEFFPENSSPGTIQIYTEQTCRQRISGVCVCVCVDCCCAVDTGCRPVTWRVIITDIQLQQPCSSHEHTALLQWWGEARSKITSTRQWANHSYLVSRQWANHSYLVSRQWANHSYLCIKAMSKPQLPLYQGNEQTTVTFVSRQWANTFAQWKS